MEKSFKYKKQMVKLNNIGRLRSSNYHVYIMTNFTKTTLYIGVTNNLVRRIEEHQLNCSEGIGFTGKYKCRFLIYWERFSKMSDAINREKQIKKWRREKKNILITSFNPKWRWLTNDCT